VSQWIVFGFGNYLSDIFDIIGARQGRVKAIVGNLNYSEEKRNNLSRRLSLLGYEVRYWQLEDFRPSSEEQYCCGFISGRDQLATRLKREYEIRFANLIHPTSYIGSSVSIGEGFVMGPHSVVAPNCRIGDFVIINRATSVGHDSSLGDFATLAPGATIGGNVGIGRKSVVGIGATIVNDVNIGENAIVGAGSLVLKDVPDHVVVVGSPTHILRRNNPVANC